MIVEAILLGLLLGILRNGRLNNFSDMRFRGGMLIVVGFVLYIMPYILRLMGTDMDNLAIFPFAAGLVSMLVVVLNMDKSGMKIIFLGGILNLVIMGLNHFQMPVDLVHMASKGMGSLVDAIQSGTIINYTSIAEGHFLSPYLGKILILPSFYPLNKLISVGDILMSIGFIFLVQGEMMMFSSKRGNMVTFQYKPNK